MSAESTPSFSSYSYDAASHEDDAASQRDEIDALTAIFGADEWTRDVTRDPEAPPQYGIEVRPDAAAAAALDPASRSVTLRVTFPPDYPSRSPPSYELEAPWLRRDQRRAVRAALEELYLDNLGESVVFAWIEKLREMVDELATTTTTTTTRSLRGDGGDASSFSSSSPSSPVKSVSGGVVVGSDENLNVLIENFDETLGVGVVFAPDAFVLPTSPNAPASEGVWEIPEIFPGEPLTDRKSTFQAFLARVVHPDQAGLVLEELKRNKKIAHATHNMWAFRIGGGTPAAPVVARCDDDGETHAGGRMLHLLEILDAVDVMVVVSRWYGGIQLGPDRFKHISNLTRNALEAQGFLRKKEGGKGGKKK